MRTHATRGFSLIEVLVSIAIFGVMLGGVFTAINQGNYLLKTSADMLQARLLANTTMENMKVKPFEKLQSRSFAEMTPQGRMTVEVQVSEFQSSTLKKIDVSVHWKDHRNQSRNLALSTLRSQYALGND
jgi:prepilin-type N-terminal cleavage/methylation domain-containing protein